MAIFSTLIDVVIVAYYIIKKYNPIFTFLFSGMIILIFAFYYFGVLISNAPTRESANFWIFCFHCGDL